MKSVIRIPTYVRACINCNERGIDSQVVSIQTEVVDYYNGVEIVHG